jgi:hypothetical protein
MVFMQTARIGGYQLSEEGISAVRNVFELQFAQLYVQFVKAQIAH